LDYRKFLDSKKKKKATLKNGLITFVFEITKNEGDVNDVVNLENL